MPKTISIADTTENRAYIQRHRIWVLGEQISSALMKQKPADPIACISQLLESDAARKFEAVDPPALETVQEARAYLQERRVAFILEDWLRALVEAKPDTPLEFTQEFFRRLSKGGAGSDGASTAAAAADAASNKEAGAVAEGAVIVLFDSTSPATTAAAKAVAVGIVEAGASAALRALADVHGAADAAPAGAVVVVASASDAAADAAILGLVAAVAAKPAAVVMAGADTMSAAHAGVQARASTLAGAFSSLVRAADASPVLFVGPAGVAGAAEAANGLGRKIGEASRAALADML